MTGGRGAWVPAARGPIVPRFISHEINPTAGTASAVPVAKSASATTGTGTGDPTFQG